MDILLLIILILSLLFLVLSFSLLSLPIFSSSLSPGEHSAQAAEQARSRKAQGGAGIVEGVSVKIKILDKCLYLYLYLYTGRGIREQKKFMTFLFVEEI